MRIAHGFGDILQLFRKEFTTFGRRHDMVASWFDAMTRTEEASMTKPIVRMPGEGKKVQLAGHPLAFLVTGDDTRHTSMFEWTIPAGFSTGLHVHRVQEETFYVLEGECDWQVGEQRVRAAAGSYLFLPPGVPHNIGNASDKPARVLMTVSPPGHEHYFEELAETVARGGAADPAKIAELRGRYDTEQLSALKG
jgi:quercetin dioxygenase-like cupin family protein